MGVRRHMVALKKIKPPYITTPAERELLFPCRPARAKATVPTGRTLA